MTNLLTHDFYIMNMFTLLIKKKKEKKLFLFGVKSVRFVLVSKVGSDSTIGLVWRFWLVLVRKRTKKNNKTFLHVSTSDSSVSKTPQIPTISYQTQASHHSDPRLRNHRRSLTSWKLHRARPRLFLRTNLRDLARPQGVRQITSEKRICLQLHGRGVFPWKQTRRGSEPLRRDDRRRRSAR